jgi:hypothetical protein
MIFKRNGTLQEKRYGSKNQLSEVVRNLQLNVNHIDVSKHFYSIE